MTPARVAMVVATMWVLSCAEPERKASAPRSALQLGEIRALRAAGHEPPAFRSPFEFDPVSFTRKGKPGRGDWLDRHREAGQTFDEFVERSLLRATPAHNVIVIQPLGNIPDEHRVTLETIRRLAESFFQMRVEVATGRPLFAGGVRHRTIQGRSVRQYFTQSVLSDLAAHRPARALAYVGVTFEDLYPDPDWNFVFGEADPDRRVAVYSLRRFQPSFSGDPDSLEARRLALRRSARLFTHETGHVFGMMHCTTNECVMNGSNSLGESDRQPIHLCPVCLHKLHHALRFDVLERYHDLLSFYESEDLRDEVAWLTTRLSRLGAPLAQPTN